MNRHYTIIKKQYNIRTIAAKTIAEVLDKKKSLSTVLPPLKVSLSDKDKGLLQEMCFGILRVLPRLSWVVRYLMHKPIIDKSQKKIYYLLMVGVYQLMYTRIPSHAVLFETVESTIDMRIPQFKSLVNGVLRQFQRQQKQLSAKAKQEDRYYLHPVWLYKRIYKAWPHDAIRIFNANNEHPPMWLRVNRLYHTTNDYLALLATNKIVAIAHANIPNAIRLNTPCNTSILPGLSTGWVTVQDVSAQLCAHLLAPQNGEEILDLCAAPGGKTTHLLEIAPKAKVTAIDIDEKRSLYIYDNLHRIGLQAKVLVGDICKIRDWYNDKKLYDRILLDAPCSATGIIRRHPDIKWLRQDSDIDQVVELQKQLLHVSWSMLKPGGTLLYVTCSILPQENREQIMAFLVEQPAAKLQSTGTNAVPGTQCLPTLMLGDGFFYAKMINLS